MGKSILAPPVSKDYIMWHMCFDELKISYKTDLFCKLNACHAGFQKMPVRVVEPAQTFGLP